jgi:hypothetical protein
MTTPTEEQLLEFFRSDIFQVERVFEEDYKHAISEFYRRFNDDVPEEGFPIIDGND